MRIWNDPAHKPARITPGSRQGAGAAAEAEFGDDLARERLRLAEADLDELAQRIDATGRRLARSLRPDDLAAYRDQVRRFIDLATSGLYRLKRERGWDRGGRQKMYVLVQQIDGRLAELTDMVLGGQADHLVIAARLDEIRGLILDLYA